MTMKAIRHTFFTIAEKSPEFKRDVAAEVERLGKWEQFAYFRQFTTCTDSYDLMCRLATTNPLGTATKVKRKGR